jgi:anti-sigma factor RsiW
LLESIVTGEASSAQAAELRAHADTCPRCRHELNWLETEAKLFRERAAREEVAQLWKGVAARSERPAERPWSRVLVALAASALVLLGVGRVALGSFASHSGADASVFHDEFGMSEPLMSPVLTLEERDNCSKLPDGVGFRCEPAIPASFLASR